MTITQPLTSSSSSTTSSSYNSSSSFDSNSLYQTSSSSGFDSLSSYQNRNQNALQRRAQQLRRWREIEELEQKENTGQAQKPKTQTKVCFSATTLFLSACAQNDIDECERLLNQKELKDSGGINVTNCDGLTALHQACIDDNEPQVRWLLSKSANINCKDNEGWTPLHASASCGNSNIVSILISHPDCDIFTLNCDNELACDVCESKECESLIRHRMNELMGCESCEVNLSGDDQDDNESEVFKDMRQQELKTIDKDINEWIQKDDNIDIKSEFERTRDPLSGATILHVCAAKGYNEILSKLLTAFESKIDLDSFRDCDGYTALHAAAFWKQPETFETLLKFGANPELPTEKTSENIISSSVLELCKNDPKFVQLIEINKEKEKIAKESETQRKIFAKRQREIRRSTQGVKKEDLEKALKIMEISQNSSNSSEKDFNSIMMKVNNTETPKDLNETQSDTSLTSTNNETDTTCWTIKLPPKLSLNSSNDNNIVNQNELNHEEQATKAAEPATPDTPPTVTMTISSTNPAEFARRRRIKRRSTGIEDDRGLIVSPDTLPDSTNPFASNETVDAAFDVILSSPSAQSRTRTTTTTTNRPISNASSTTSLNSLRSTCDSEDGHSLASSMQSLDCNESDSNSHSKFKNSDSIAANNLKNSTVSLVSENDLKAIQSGTSVSDEIDYKKLCKQLIRENETLRKRIKELEETDKKREQEFSREKRSLQRTISEQEEEMKAMTDIKADNVRLKDENAALIRVISKLSK